MFQNVTKDDIRLIEALKNIKHIRPLFLIDRVDDHQIFSNKEYAENAEITATNYLATTGNEIIFVAPSAFRQSVPTQFQIILFTASRGYTTILDKKEISLELQCRALKVFAIADCVYIFFQIIKNQNSLFSYQIHVHTYQIKENKIQVKDEQVLKITTLRLEIKQYVNLFLMDAIDDLAILILEHGKFNCIKKLRLTQHWHPKVPLLLYKICGFALKENLLFISGWGTDCDTERSWTSIEIFDIANLPNAVFLGRKDFYNVFGLVGSVWGYIGADRQDFIS